MDHFREIKPVLNKLSKYNVYDTLDVISIYLRAIIAQKERSSIRDIEAPEYNAIELYFADFLIVNAIIYCSETKGELSLRKQNDRYKIFKPVAELSVQYLPAEAPVPVHKGNGGGPGRPFAGL